MVASGIGRGAAALVLAAASASLAEPPLSSAYLVRDINTTPIIYSGHPRQFTVVGGRLYFVAETPQGTGLWTSDGSAAGTVLLRTLQVIGNLTGVGSRLFFVAVDNGTGAELWTSDGTSAGTRLVRDISPGGGYAFSNAELANHLAAVGDVLFFAANDGRHGGRKLLWRSDGTAAGTVAVGSVAAGEMVAAGDVLLFAGDDGVHGGELWRSDGTAEGTQLVRDINAGIGGSEILDFTAVGATIFFRADDGVHGAELWKSDATTAGTALVKDITPGAAPSYPDQLVAVGGELYFQTVDELGDRELWRSDGSADGTTAVAPVRPTILSPPVALGASLLFENGDDLHGSELWTSDGTAGGTALLKDINQGVGNAYPQLLTVVDDVAFFMADDGIHGAELWRSDGTAPGTVLVRDVNAGAAASGSGYPDTLADLNGVLVFAANDGIHGVELWSSDGTRDGTALLQDVWPGPSTESAVPAALTPRDGLLFFTAEDSSGLSGLWRTDGTESGTRRIGDVVTINPRRPFESDKPLAVLDRRLVFSADDAQQGNELWSSDGTTAGTALIKDIWPGPDASLPREFTRIGTTMFFSADDGTHGRELWRTDGTAAGTDLVRDIVPGPMAASPVQLTAVNDRLFFTTGAEYSTQLWVSDGTAEGTMHLQDLFLPGDLTAVGDTLYFTGGTTLWTSDGTVDGTRLLGDFHPVSGQYQPNQLTAVGEDLFFAAEPSATVQLLVIGPQHHGSLRELNKFAPSMLTAAAGQLFFVAADDEHGSELWRSDGTMEGTRLVRDINPGTAASDVAALSPDGGRLLFRACDGQSCGLWETDGSQAGTRQLAEVDGVTTRFVVSGGLAYFGGYDFAYGSELRAVALPPSACLGDCDRNGAVSVVELVRMVGIALGEINADTCSHGSVSIDRLVTAVRNALTGCPPDEGQPRCDGESSPRLRGEGFLSDPPRDTAADSLAPPAYRGATFIPA